MSRLSGVPAFMFVSLASSGTTLNLLKFPIMRPSFRNVALRRVRLKQELSQKKELRNMMKFRRKERSSTWELKGMLQEEMKFKKKNDCFFSSQFFSAHESIHAHADTQMQPQIHSVYKHCHRKKILLSSFNIDPRSLDWSPFDIKLLLTYIYI